MTGEILFLSHRIPYPPDKGDKIRSWRLLSHLASRFDVHLAAFVDDPEDLAHRTHLESVCASVTLAPLNKRWATARSARGFLSGAPLTISYYDDRRMRQAVRALGAKPLRAEIAFSSAMAQYFSAGERPRLIDLCDADSAKWADYARAAAGARKGPMRGVYAREAEKLAATETEIINAADAVFAISEAEAKVLAGRDGVRRPVHWFGNGVDTEYFNPEVDHGASIPDAARADVVFVGVMDYQPNIDAVLWFLHESWPAIRARAPGARFAIVGAAPTATIRAHDGRDGVSVTGRVADVRPWLCAAKVAIAPMRIARGVQNKVLEAMAMAAPVVTTSAGIEGIAASAGSEVIVADTAAAFADEISRLLENNNLAHAIGAAARRRVRESHQWPAQLARFDAVFDSVLASRNPSGHA